MPSIERDTTRGENSNLQDVEEKINQIENWLDKLEKSLGQQSSDDQQAGQVNVSQDDSLSTSLPKISPKKVIVLPLSKKELEKGLHSPITSSLRWLAEWSIRMIKMYHNRVRYSSA